MKTTNQQNNAQVDGAIVVSKPYRCIKLGLDVHADSIRVVRMIDGATPQPAQKMTPQEFPQWAAKQLSLADKVCSCYEAGPLGYGLHRKLLALQIENIVIRPQVLDEYRKRVKTDKTDALALVKRLDAYVRGNRKAFAVVRVPTEQEEQERTVSRQREQLVREVRRLGAQGRSLMLFHGFHIHGVWWRLQWKTLEEKLPDWLVERLEVFRALLKVLDAQIRKLTQGVEAQAPAARPRGLGALSFEVIRREIGDWRRFSNRRQIGSYTGLCAGVSSSGGSRKTLSINKCGNPRLRSSLVTMAWRLVHYQPRCRLIQKWKRVLLKSQAAAGARKKAIVAVARQLAVDLWRWQTGRIQPDQLGWQMT
jgi:transposase